MKLTFFLIAFCLVFLRVCYSWSGFDKKGKDNFTVTITNGDDYEQIKHGGEMVLTDDETGIKSMAPGAYFKYRKNDKKFVAESNLEGKISYEINGGDKVYSITGDGKNIETEAIGELLAYGFDAPSRAVRIYKAGGYGALLGEVDKMKSAGAALVYLKPMLDDDFLSQQNMVAVIRKIGSLGSDIDKMGFLKKLNASRLNDSQTIQAYFEVAGSLGSDVDKVAILNKFINEDSVSVTGFDKIMDITTHLGADIDKRNVLYLMMGKGLVVGERFDRVLDAASHFGSEIDKANAYRKLMETKGITEDGWISVIGKIAQIGSEFDRGNLLIAVASKMPKTDNTKATYLSTAKTIHDGVEYAKVIKAVQ